MAQLTQVSERVVGRGENMFDAGMAVLKSNFAGLGLTVPAFGWIQFEGYVGARASRPHLTLEELLRAGRPRSDVTFHCVSRPLSKILERCARV